MEKLKKFIHKWAWTLLIIYCIVGVIYPYIGIAALLCMLAPVVVAFARGRMWCGSFCPRGSFNDNILSKLSLKRKIPKVMKSRYLKGIFLVVVMGAFVMQMIYAWGSLLDVGRVFVRMIFITTGITIVLGIIFSHRAWCVICPMGTMAQIVTRLRSKNSKIKNVTFNQQKCVSCNLCTKACPIEIDVLSCKGHGKVERADCLKCNACIEKCPKKSLYIA